ncbi:MAG: DUF6556 family protein, partial [Anaerovoracaceae bacterium]
ILGYVIGVWLTPTVMSILTINTVTATANPLIFIGSALFALVTVFFSTAKAAKLAGKVSPIEALRSSESINMKKTTRKSGGINIPKMGMANVLRSKKKAVLVTISLSLSLIILNATFSIVNSFDIDKYTDTFIRSDFVLSDVSRGNFTVDFYNRPISQRYIDDVAKQPGVEEISKVFFQSQKYTVDDELRTAALAEKALVEKESKERASTIEKALENGDASAHIYGVDEYGLTKLEMFSKIDKSKFMSGDYVIVSPYFTSGEHPIYKVGEKISLYKDDGKIKKYEVLASGSIPYCMSAQFSNPVGITFILPESEYLAIKKDAEPMIAMVSAAPKSLSNVERFLDSYVKKNKEWGFKSKAKVKIEFENLQKTYLLVGSILSFILAFIGIMNFLNTMITSVISRRRELAMLQSIGMTGKQLGQMLVSEGFVYTALTAVAVLSVGSAIGYGLVYSVAGGTIMFTPSFSVAPVLYCLPCLAVLAVIVPIVCYKMASRDSIVERLREVE